MGVKTAKAMGHHVTLISSLDKKRQEALDHLGDDKYLVSSDNEKMQQAADLLDYIIDTVPFKSCLSYTFFKDFPKKYVLGTEVPVTELFKLNYTKNVFLVLIWDPKFHSKHKHP